MPKQELIVPKFNGRAFTCSHCNFNSQQDWGSNEFFDNSYRGTGVDYSNYISYSRCQICKKFSIWYEGKMTYPEVVQVDDPNEDMPDDVRQDYREAGLIVEKSTRAAAALLRLAIEKLCKYLGEEGKINDMIGNLVKKGLPVQVQQALDTVRVVGNDSVHAGQIDLRDDKETVYKLFKLVNFICDKMITEPKYISDTFDALPESKKEGIQQRDKNE
jgi:hypothetical protein